VPVALHAATDDLAFKDIESGDKVVVPWRL